MVEIYLCFDLHLTVNFPNLDIPRSKFWLNTRFTLKKGLLCLVLFLERNRLGLNQFHVLIISFRFPF
jgi:hypothetical protein